VNKPKSQLGFERMYKICGAAETLFGKNGFYDTSVTDICRPFSSDCPLDFLSPPV
jgi:hypothetical protein